MESMKYISPTAALKLAEKEKMRDQGTDWIVMVEKIRVRTKKFMTATVYGKFYSNVLLLLSVLSSLQYIYQTYLKSHSSSTKDSIPSQLFFFDLVEKALAGLFSFDWTLSFFVADHKLAHVTRLVDLFP